MTIHHEVSEFIVRNDTQIVELECNDNYVQGKNYRFSYDQRQRARLGEALPYV